MFATIKMPESWIQGEKMPYEEGTHMEYKEAKKLRGSMATSMEKYKETLIGLLNVGGGYLVLGVTNEGIIQGMDETDEQSLDKFRVAIDVFYGTLCYQDGSALDPMKTSFKVSVHSLKGVEGKHIVVVRVFNAADTLTVQTKNGVVFYRLNASNYRYVSEAIYRHREVQGMIRTVQDNMQKIIKDQHDSMLKMTQRHQEELERAIRQEKDKSDLAMRTLVRSVSDSLYAKHKMATAPPSFCSRLIGCIRWIK